MLKPEAWACWLTQPEVHYGSTLSTAIKSGKCCPREAFNKTLLGTVGPKSISPIAPEGLTSDQCDMPRS